jgi:DNA invertase Pin-like site-specific DNA recombinase
MEIYFYLRISTQNQQVESQLQEFKKHPSFDPKKVFVDKISGSVPFFERPEAVMLFDKLTSSNNIKTLVVYSWDRLGRNLIDVLQTVELLTKNGVNIKSIKEGLETLLPDGKPNPVAKITLSILSNLAEMT